MLLPAHTSRHTTYSSTNINFRHVFSIKKGIKLAVNDISTIPSGQRSSIWVGTSVENLVWLGTKEVKFCFEEWKKKA